MLGKKHFYVVFLIKLWDLIKLPIKRLMKGKKIHDEIKPTQNLEFFFI